MSEALFNFIKTILAVLLLPLAWAAASGFYHHVMGFPRDFHDFFFWGMFGFVLLYVFFYQFWGVYEAGQKVIGGIFQFASPANQFIANCIPFYFTLILLLFYGTTNFLAVRGYDHYFMFFAGFAFTMHVLLTAQDMQVTEKSFIKPSYLVSIMLVIILLSAVCVLLFDLAFVKFTFPDFVRSVADEAVDIYAAAGKRIFLLK